MTCGKLLRWKGLSSASMKSSKMCTAYKPAPFFNSGIPDSKLLNNAMDHLEGAIRLSLRKGDVAARFSAAQYVVLLPTVTFESGSKVLERIVNRFSREHRNIPVIIHTKLQPLDPIPL